jgi:pimeloyl-ACP methyl ester carboxylesterase
MFKTAAIAIAAGYAGLLGLSRAAYRSVLYPAPRNGLTTAPRGGVVRKYKASDGEPLQCAVYQASDAVSATMVFFHGNGETIADSVPLGAEMVRRGLRFVALEYRGYGTSPSDSPSEEGLYADADGLLSALHDLGITPGHITLWGSSLGTGVAVEMAKRGHASKLILQAPYTSIPAVAQRFLPIVPMGLVIGDSFDSLSKAPALKLPTLILHGDADGVVPYDMGVTMSKTIANAKLLTVRGGGHNDIFSKDGLRLLNAIAEHASR